MCVLFQVSVTCSPKALALRSLRLVFDDVTSNGLSRVHMVQRQLVFRSHNYIATQRLARMLRDKY